jgi:hypothetical protein
MLASTVSPFRHCGATVIITTYLSQFNLLWHGVHGTSPGWRWLCSHLQSSRLALHYEAQLSPTNPFDASVIDHVPSYLFYT